MSIPRVFEERADLSNSRIELLHSELVNISVRDSNATIYATGSIARREANSHSDLDLFILDAADESLGEPALSNIQAILLRADLIRASDLVGFPPFSGDGVYLEAHSVTNLIARTGRSDDDSTNALTARLLLVLESLPIFNQEGHGQAKERIIASYWRDFEKNAESFLPVFLVNDIMRFWKTLCLNYEAARTSGVPTGYGPERWRNRNRLKDIKLKFSRLWTCHATIAHLLWLSYEGRSVTPSDASSMLGMTPLERLMAIDSPIEGVTEVRNGVIESYAWFLEVLAGSREDALAWVGNNDNWLEARGRGGEFGEAMADLLGMLGGESPLYRFLLV